MKLFLPDTNIFIYANKGENPHSLYMTSWITEKSLCISAIVAAEFLSGGEESERDKFQALIDRFGTLPIDTTVAQIASEYKRRFAKIKPGLKLPDCLIAATAKLYKATIVTENIADFPMKDIEFKNISSEE